MSITTYDELKTQIATWAHRTDLTSVIPDFIALCEASIQVQCKLLEFEDTSSVTVTAGIGTIPTGFLGARSAYWEGDLDRPLEYVTPDRFDSYRNKSGSTSYYTVSGTEIRTIPLNTGNIVLTYKKRFTPLSSTNTTNEILTNYPDVYLHGSLAQLYAYVVMQEKAAVHGQLFNNAIARINKDNRDRRYAGPLTVRAA